jgi:MoaA/NifB/PqqE/SkfB family radical SAM enzyme
MQLSKDNFHFKTYRKLKRPVSRLVAKSTESLLPSEVVLWLRTRRDWKGWVDALTPEVLDDLSSAPAGIKRRLFKMYVRLVEVETHAKCNRVCSFCPNVIVDRRLNETVTEPQMLERVFRELGTIYYTGEMKVARYSEPLTNKKYLYQTIRCARRLVPGARLSVVTNTDYLTSVVLDELKEVGLDVLYMSLYLKANEGWTPEIAHRYNARLVRKLGMTVKSKEENGVSVHYTFDYKGLYLRSACHNWNGYGTDRGAAIREYANQERLGPCREPFHTFVIDYNGSVMPCCNLRSDLPRHRELVVADLWVPGTSIFDVYAGRLSAWRRSMVGFGTKEFPCTTCRHRDLSKSLVAPISARLEKRLREIGRDKLYVAPGGMSPP